MAVFDCALGRELTEEELAELPAPPPMPFEDRREAMRAEVDRRRDRCFVDGFTVPAGPLAGHVLQTRDIEDRTNWLTSQAAYAAAVAMGGGAVEDAFFRTATNETVVLSYADGLAALLMMAAWGKAVMGRSWALKDAIAAAADDAALVEIDLGAGWP